MSSGEPVVREVDLDALRRNHARVRERLPAGTALICSVKANAYGHGSATISGALAELGIHAVATASADEAQALRDGGIGCGVLLFGGQPPEAAPAIAARGITITVPHAQTAAAIAGAATPETSVYLKVDCGLGRLGVTPGAAEALLRETLLPSRASVDGIYTHLPFHDADGERWARAGLEQFAALIERLRARGIEIPIVQALSSPGISAGLPLTGNAVCPGRLLYGLIPSVGDAGTWGLEPVLRSIRSRIVHMRGHDEDARIGGSGRYRVAAGSTTAVIPFGRSSGNLADTSAIPQVVHRGRRARVISVSLEHATIDLGDSSAEIGDEVYILGGDGSPISLEEFGEWSHLEPLDALVALDRGTAS